MADAPTADEPWAAGPRAAESSPHETPELRWGHAESEPRANEPRVAEPSSHENRAPEPSSHETPVPDSGGEDTFSDDSYSESELVEGGNVYQRGGTKLPPTPVTHDQRWLITRDGEK